ncbi:hypothetical protein FHG87_011436 [Trinorchestia longiramus]|nr:hypothetical protein FHG87_011436 [Trinorchestia longiramus]
MVWAVVTATGRSPLVFVLCGAKLNSERSFPLFWNQRCYHGLQNIFKPMESPTGFSTITWLQRYNLDSEEHSIFHKQRCMASKEPRPQSLGLFYLVHFGDKDLSYLSHYFRVPQSKNTKGIGSNSTRTDTYRLRCIRNLNL